MFGGSRGMFGAGWRGDGIRLSLMMVVIGGGVGGCSRRRRCCSAVVVVVIFPSRGPLW